MDEISELREMVRTLTLELASLKKPKKKVGEVNPDHLMVREAFTMTYARTFGHDYPVWGAKENTCIKVLVASAGVKKALWLIRWYMVWSDPYVVQAGHPIGLLVSSLVKMEAQLRRGGKYFDQVAEAKTTKKMEMENREKEQEINAYSARNARQRDNAKIGFGAHGVLPGSRQELVSSERHGSDNGALLDRESGHKNPRTGEDGLQEVSVDSRTLGLLAEEEGAEEA